MMNVGWIGVDLDGTLADHYWSKPGEQYDELRIGDPIPAMVERVKTWLAEGWEVRIFTARVAPNGSAPGFPDDRRVEIGNAISEWCKQHVGVALVATCVKDYRMIELWDDRAIRVIHNEGKRCCDAR